MLICKALRNERIKWPSAVDAAYSQALFKRIAYHGVTALLYQQLHSTGAWDNCPVELCYPLRDKAHQQAVQELIRQHELIEVLAALAQAGIHPLLLKGTPLAYTIYSSPALRDRGDTDFLISRKELEATETVLAKLGYQRRNAVSGQFISTQCSFSKHYHGLSHVLDVHWKISNAQIFAQALTYSEMAAQAIAIPSLGPYARAPGLVHALLHACLHRINHFHSPYYSGAVPHYGGNRLIWLYDIHLLAQTMEAQQWEQLLCLARAKHLYGVCLDGLTISQQAFATTLPQGLLNSLNKVRHPSEIAVSRLTKSRQQYFRVNILALPSWSERFILLKEILFPPPAYMLAKYRKTNPLLLPLFYLRRATTGIRKLF
jgi:hypothetical protein